MRNIIALAIALLCGTVLAQDMVPIPGSYVPKSNEEVISYTQHDGITGELLYEWKKPSQPQFTKEESYAALVGKGYWTWTEDAPHHQAVVLVSQNGGQGTGALVWRSADSSVGLVATAAHVMSRGTGLVKWQSGYTSRAEAAAALSGADGSLLWVKPPKDAITIPVSTEDPPLGAYVEHCGFGGPGDNLRHFWGTVREYEQDGTLITNSYLLNGDSGGPVIYEGKLVGMNSGGYQTRRVGIGTGSGSDWPLHSPALTCGPGPLRQMLFRIGAQCGPGQCPPSYGSPGGFGGPQYYPPQQQRGIINIGGPKIYQQGGGGFDPFVPPSPDSQDPPASPDPPPNQTDLEIDYDKLISLLIPKLAEDDRLRGPAGAQGPAGPAGTAGPAGASGPAGRDGAGVTPAQVAAALEAIKADLDLSKRVVVMDGATRQVIDDETFGPGEAIVLDVSQLIRQK